MSTAVATQYDVESIPALIDRAAQELVNARSAGEVLEARDKASLAYDLAKKQARMHRAREAHDTLISAAHRAQARALEIESQAKMRLADEYDAAQERGEVQGHGGQGKREVAGSNLPSISELGLRKDQIHEARQFRDAEKAHPGIISQAINGKLDRGEEPTKAYLREVVTEAALDALRGGGKAPSRKNPIYNPSPMFDATAGLNGSCRRINELIEEHGAQHILEGCVDEAMQARSVALIEKCRDNLNRVLELYDA